ncbi:hypothetical protein JCM16418A_12190 [Paenibacillus pini]
MFLNEYMRENDRLATWSQAVFLYSGTINHMKHELLWEWIFLRMKLYVKIEKGGSSDVHRF